jgi:glyoxylase-like metal-dependent hydrolase (beta-lactamase superfamily II)
VDPGAAANKMVETILAEELDLRAVLLTHAHLDHVEGVHHVRAVLPDVPILLHPDDHDLYFALPRQAAAFGLPMPAPQPPPTGPLLHGEPVAVGACTLHVRHAPGHAPGHVILVAPEHGFAIVGDVVFQGSIGRSDLPGGDFYTLMASIREQVLTLPDETVLYPGHGPPTTVGDERVGNPFLVPHFGGRLA